MKLHLPLGLRKAVYHTFLAGLIAAAGTANADSRLDGITYKAYSTAKNPLAGIFERFYSISNGAIGDNKGCYFVAYSDVDTYIKRYLNSSTTNPDGLTEDDEEIIALREAVAEYMVKGAAIVLGNNQSPTNANGTHVADSQGYAQSTCHLWVQGDVIIRSDSFMAIDANHSLDASGYKVIIGSEGENLHSMDQLAGSGSPTYTVPVYGGVLSFISAGATDAVTLVRTLRLGSLQTYMGAYVNDLKTFIVDKNTTASPSSNSNVVHSDEGVTHYATSDKDMDVRNNGNANGYILTDLGGNDIEIQKGNFSLDTEYTTFNMSSGATTAAGYNYDKMNTGDYGYLKSLFIGSTGTSIVKALLNDIDVVAGVTIYDGSELDMDGYELRASSITGRVTNAASFAVGDFTYDSTIVADYEDSHGQKAAAQKFAVTSFTANAHASVTKGNGAGKMDVDSSYDDATKTYTYTLSNIEVGASLFVHKGAFVLADSRGVENLSIGSGAGVSLASGDGLTLNEGQSISIEADGCFEGDVTAKKGSSVSLDAATTTTSPISGKLTIDGASLFFSNVGTGSGVTVSSLELGGNINTVTLNGLGNLASGETYTLMTCGSCNASADLSEYFALTQSGNEVYTYALAQDEKQRALTLAVDVVDGVHVWKGAADGTWSNETSDRPWLVGDVADYFEVGDTVLFESSKDTSTTATVSGTVAPGNITVAGAGNTTWQADATDGGTIAATGTLIKQGSGTLTIEMDNSFSGGTYIYDGTVAITNAAALGGSGVTLDGGALVVEEGDMTVASATRASITTQDGGIEVAEEQLGAGNTLTASGDIRVKNISSAGNTLSSTEGNISINSLSEEATGTTISAEKGNVTLETASTLSADSSMAANSVNLTEATIKGSVTGDITVSSGGTLALTGADAANQSRVQGDVTFSGEGTLSLAHATITGKLAINGTALVFSNVDTDSGVSVAELVLGDTPNAVTVNGMGDLATGTTYTLLTYSGYTTSGSSGELFTLVKPEDVAYTYTLTLDETQQALTLVVGVANGVHVWDGGDAGIWSTDVSTLNWLDDSTPDCFTDADNVLFAGKTDTVVTVRSTVAPDNITVAGAGNTTWQADDSGGTIAATGALTKLGTGTLTIGIDNSFSGGTDIYEGTVVISTAEALGGGGVTLYGGALEVETGSMVVASATHATIITEDDSLTDSNAITVKENINNSTLTAASGDISVDSVSGAANTLTAIDGNINIRSLSKDATGTFISAEKGSVTLGAASTLSADSRITADSVSLTGASIKGTVTASATNEGKGELAMVGGTATGATLTAEHYITGAAADDAEADPVTLTDSTLHFNKATVSARDTLNIMGANDGSTIGTITNNGTLNIGKSDTATTDLSVTDATLGGSVNVTGGSKLTTSGAMSISGNVVLGDASQEGDSGSLVSAGIAGMDISGSVTGTGDLTSKDGTISVTGTVDVTGTVTADTLTSTKGTEATAPGSVTVTGKIDVDTIKATEGADIKVSSTETDNRVGMGIVSGEWATLEFEGGAYNPAGSTSTITAEKGGELRLTNTTYNGNVQVNGKQDGVDGSAASTLTMTHSSVNGNVNFVGDNTFNINGENHVFGKLNVSAGTVTSQDGSVEVHDTELDGQMQEQALRVEGTYNINDAASYIGAVDMQGGTLNIMSTAPAKVDVDVLTFVSGGEVNINTDGSNVDFETVAMMRDGTININGSNGTEDATLTLHTLTGDTTATLTLGKGTTVTGTSTVVVDKKNENFAADINLDADKLTVQEDEAIGSTGTLAMKDGSTLAAEATDENTITLSKAIRSDKTADGGNITIETARELELKGEVDVDGEITKAGGGQLTFRDNMLRADKVNLDNGSTIKLDGETTDVENFAITKGTLEVTDNSTLEAAKDDSNAVTLNGKEAADAVVKVTGTELETGVTLAVEGKGTIQTDMKTTLTDEVTGGASSELVKTGAAELVLANSNLNFKGRLVHTEGSIVATVSDALGTGTVQLADGAPSDAKALEVELDAADGTFSNDWDAQTDACLVATQAATLSGAFRGNGGTITKTGEMVTLTDTADAGTTKATDYTISLTSPEEGKTNGLTLDNAGLRGTLAAEANTDIIVTGGESTVGALAFTGDGNAAHNTRSDAATRVTIMVAGADKLVSATGERLSAANTTTGTRGAQLIIDDWSVAEPFTQYADGEKLMVAKGITGFDKEIVHDLELQNVNLVEDAEGNSYAAVSINHKGARKNAFEQAVSDAITSSEGAEGRLGELVEALNHTGSEADAKAALNSIGGAGAAATMAAQMNATHDHMRTLRGAIGQPEPHEAWFSGKERPQWVSPHTNLWTMATGASAELDEDSSGGVGYSRDEAGFLVGGDVTLGRSTLVGLAAGYSRSKVDSSSYTIKGDQYFVDVYARKNFGRFTQAATLGVGIHDWSLERTVRVKTGDLYDDFSGKGEGQAKGLSVNFSYEAAYTFRFREKHALAPLLTFESSLNSLDGYRESGSLDNAGLNVDFEDTMTATLGLGARYTYEFDGFGTAQRKGQLSARAMFIADMGDVNGKMTARFIGGGASFHGESTETSNTGILVGADTLVPVSLHWSLFGHVNAEFRSDYTDVSAGAGVKYTF